MSVAIGATASLPTFFYRAFPKIDWMTVSSAPFTTMLMSIAGILVISIPIIGFVHFLMSTFGNWKPMSFASRMLLLILWLTALGVGTFFMFNFGMMAIH